MDECYRAGNDQHSPIVIRTCESKYLWDRYTVYHEVLADEGRPCYIFVCSSLQVHDLTHNLSNKSAGQMLHRGKAPHGALLTADSTGACNHTLTPGDGMAVPRHNF
jgi:hypothetical protein